MYTGGFIFGMLIGLHSLGGRIYGGHISVLTGFYGILTETTLRLTGNSVNKLIPL